MKNKQDRQEALLRVVAAHGKIAITQLQELAEGSRATFQRDLTDLEKNGRIQRSYGMACYVDAVQDEPWMSAMQQLRLISNLDAKKRIGLKAQDFIGDQETVFVTHGTTTRQIFNRVDVDKGFNVFTEGIDILCKCAGLKNVCAYLLGGYCNYETMQVEYIPLVSNHLENINIQKLFMGVAAVSHINGVTFYDFTSYQLLKTIAEKCDEIIVLADSSKFGRKAMVDCIPIQKISTIITDTGLDESICKEYERIGVNCIRV